MSALIGPALFLIAQLWVPQSAMLGMAIVSMDIAAVVPHYAPDFGTAESWLGNYTAGFASNAVNVAKSGSAADVSSALHLLPTSIHGGTPPSKIPTITLNPAPASRANSSTAAGNGVPTHDLKTADTVEETNALYHATATYGTVLPPVLDVLQKGTTYICDHYIILDDEIPEDTCRSIVATLFIISGLLFGVLCRKLWSIRHATCERAILAWQAIFACLRTTRAAIQATLGQGSQHFLQKAFQYGKAVRPVLVDCVGFLRRWIDCIKAVHRSSSERVQIVRRWLGGPIFWLTSEYPVFGAIVMTALSVIGMFIIQPAIDRCLTDLSALMPELPFGEEIILDRLPDIRLNATPLGKWILKCSQQLGLVAFILSNTAAHYAKVAFTSILPVANPAAQWKLFVKESLSNIVTTKEGLLGLLGVVFDKLGTFVHVMRLSVRISWKVFIYPFFASLCQISNSCGNEMCPIGRQYLWRIPYLASWTSLLLLVPFYMANIWSQAWITGVPASALLFYTLYGRDCSQDCLIIFGTLIFWYLTWHYLESASHVLAVIDNFFDDRPSQGLLIQRQFVIDWWVGLTEPGAPPPSSGGDVNETSIDNDDVLGSQEKILEHLEGFAKGAASPAGYNPRDSEPIVEIDEDYEPFQPTVKPPTSTKESSSEQDAFDYLVPVIPSREASPASAHTSPPSHTSSIEATQPQASPSGESSSQSSSRQSSPTRPSQFQPSPASAHSAKQSPPKSSPLRTSTPSPVQASRSQEPPSSAHPAKSPHQCSPLRSSPTNASQFQASPVATKPNVSGENPAEELTASESMKQSTHTDEPLLKDANITEGPSTQYGPISDHSPTSSKWRSPQNKTEEPITSRPVSPIRNIESAAEDGKDENGPPPTNVSDQSPSASHQPSPAPSTDGDDDDKPGPDGSGVPATSAATEAPAQLNTVNENEVSVFSWTPEKPQSTVEGLSEYAWDPVLSWNQAESQPFVDTGLDPYVGLEVPVPPPTQSGLADGDIDMEDEVSHLDVDVPSPSFNFPTIPAAEEETFTGLKLEEGDIMDVEIDMVDITGASTAFPIHGQLNTTPATTTNEFPELMQGLENNTLAVHAAEHPPTVSNIENFSFDHVAPWASNLSASPAQPVPFSTTLTPLQDMHTQSAPVESYVPQGISVLQPAGSILSPPHLGLPAQDSMDETVDEPMTETLDENPQPSSSQGATKDPGGTDYTENQDPLNSSKPDDGNDLDEELVALARPDTDDASVASNNTLYRDPSPSGQENKTSNHEEASGFDDSGNSGSYQDQSSGEDLPDRSPNLSPNRSREGADDDMDDVGAHPPTSETDSEKRLSAMLKEFLEHDAPPMSPYSHPDSTSNLHPNNGASCGHSNNEFMFGPSSNRPSYALYAPAGNTALYAPANDRLPHGASTDVPLHAPASNRTTYGPAINTTPTSPHYSPSANRPLYGPTPNTQYGPTPTAPQYGPTAGGTSFEASNDATAAPLVEPSPTSLEETHAKTLEEAHKKTKAMDEAAEAAKKAAERDREQIMQQDNVEPTMNVDPGFYEPRRDRPVYNAPPSIKPKSTGSSIINGFVISNEELKRVKDPVMITNHPRKVAMPRGRRSGQSSATSPTTSAFPPRVPQAVPPSDSQAMPPPPRPQASVPHQTPVSPQTPVPPQNSTSLPTPPPPRKIAMPRGRRSAHSPTSSSSAPAAPLPPSVPNTCRPQAAASSQTITAPRPTPPPVPAPTRVPPSRANLYDPNAETWYDFDGIAHDVIYNDITDDMECYMDDGETLAIRPDSENRMIAYRCAHGLWQPYSGPG